MKLDRPLPSASVTQRERERESFRYWDLAVQYFCVLNLKWPYCVIWSIPVGMGTVMNVLKLVGVTCRFQNCLFGFAMLDLFNSMVFHLVGSISFCML